MHEDTSRDSETQKMKFVSQGLFREKSNTSFLSFGLMGMSRIAQTAFLFAFPTDLCNLKTKLLWHFFALYFSFHACLKKRHIIIAAFYSKEQKIKRAINDLGDLAPTPVCLFVSHRPKNMSLLSSLYFAFFLLPFIHFITLRHKLCVCRLTPMHMHKIHYKAPI